MRPSPGEVTQWLIAWSQGDRAALDKLMPLLYDELRRLAHRYMRRERPGHTLQTTALVNEAYLRLIDQKSVSWQNRAHFFALAARMMRQILVDYARRRHVRWEGRRQRVSLEEAATVSSQRAAELVAVDDALTSLATIDPRQSQIVELRFFGGLTIEETAEVLHISHATVEREWNMARAWLYREIGQNGSWRSRNQPGARVHSCFREEQERRLSPLGLAEKGRVVWGIEGSFFRNRPSAHARYEGNAPANG